MQRGYIIGCQSCLQFSKVVIPTIPKKHPFISLTLWGPKSDGEREKKLLKIAICICWVLVWNEH